MSDRKIYILGDIDNESYGRFSRKLARLESESIDPIQIELMSDGGYSYAALAFSDRINNCKCPIYIDAFGLIASAATLILAAGDMRRIAANAWVMVHEDEVALPDGAKVSAIEKHAAHSRRLEDQWNKLMEHYTGTSVEVWALLNLAETFLPPSECKSLGLVDEII